MKKVFALLLVFAFIIGVFIYHETNTLEFNIADFPGADSSVLTSYSYDDVQLGYRSSQVVNMISHSIEISSGTLYREFLYFNSFFLSLGDYIYGIEISSEGAAYIEDQINSGSLVIRFPYEYISVFLLLDNTFDVASGDLDGDVNSVASYLSDGYVVSLVYDEGEYVLPQLHDVSNIDEALSLLFNYYDFCFVPKEGLTDYRIERFLLNNLYGYTEYYQYCSYDLYSGFRVVSIADSNGFGYIQRIILNIEALGNPPELPDVDFGDQPLVFIASYFRWIVEEIQYLFKFMRCFTMGVF